MKKVLLSMAAVLAATAVFAQTGSSGLQDTLPAPLSRSYTARQAYIGISAGPSIPLGDFSNAAIGGAKTGLTVGLISIGYKFTNYIGLAASWNIGSNSMGDVPWTREKGSWLYWGMSAGPMLSLPLMDRLELDIKPMVGYSVVTLPDIGNGKESEVAFSYTGSAMGRYHLSNHVSVIAHADYYHAKATFNENNVAQKLSTLSVCAGVAYRFH